MQVSVWIICRHWLFPLRNSHNSRFFTLLEQPHVVCLRFAKIGKNLLCLICYDFYDGVAAEPHWNSHDVLLSVASYHRYRTCKFWEWIIFPNCKERHKRLVCDCFGEGIFGVYSSKQRHVWQTVRNGGDWKAWWTMTVFVGFRNITTLAWDCQKIC